MYRLSCEINCEIGSQVVHTFTISMRRGEKARICLGPTPTPHCQPFFLGCFLSWIMIACVQKQILHMKESHFHPTS